MKKFKDGGLGFGGWAALAILGYVWSREAAHDLYLVHYLGGASYS